MYKFLVLILAILISCTSSLKMYYEREKNPESQLLNEYLIPLFKLGGQYKKDVNIYLADSLWPVSVNLLPRLNSYLSYETDSLNKEALLDLSNFNKNVIPINFSQLTNIEGLKLHPKDFKDIEIDFDDWIYYLGLPGFSKDSTLICFTSSYYCGPLCACFSLIFMKKENNQWVFIKERIIMQS